MDLKGQLTWLRMGSRPGRSPDLTVAQEQDLR